MNKQTDFDYDYSALGWVKNELDATLRQAAEALESCAENSTDRAELQRCITSLHQVRGILQILELHGAAALAEEMEQLGQALLVDPSMGGELAQETLMRAILQLQDYLERVVSGQPDATILLLPLINELRSARGAPIIAESALFAPHLKLLCEQPEQSRWPRDGTDSVTLTARRMRSFYQRGLLAYLRGQDPASGLNQMREALLAMDQASPDDRDGTLWWLAAGLIDVLDAGELVEHAAAARRLLSQVEHQFKAALESGAGVAMAEDLLRGLLYHLALVSPVTERVAAIQTFYDLPSLMAEHARIKQSRERLFGPGRDALVGVARAICEDLAHVQDTLDLHARGSVRNAEDLTTTADSLSRIADTLGVIGLADACSLVQEQAVQVRALHDEGGLENHRALQVAEALLYVESSLANLVDGRQQVGQDDDDEVGAAQGAIEESEYRPVFIQAISEAITELGYLKESIVQFVESGERQRLESIERRFGAVRGSLILLELERVPELIGTTEHCLRECMLSTAEFPSPQILEALADAITGVEYYLEAMRDGRPYGEQGLDVSEDRLRCLVGLSPGSGEASQAFASEPAPAVAEEARSSRAPPAVAEQSMFLADAGIDSSKKRGRVDPEVPVWGEQVDPEILEIFLEEADEVLDTLREVFPRWQREVDDTEALLTIRRLFHTLKGSGRLAGALLLGELAWSVENLLNRVLDHTLEPSSQVYASVAEALSVIPELITELRDATSPSCDARHLIRKISILSEPTRHNELADLTPGAAGAAEHSAKTERGTVRQEPAVSAPCEPGHAMRATPARGESARAESDAEALRVARSAVETLGKTGDARLDPVLYEIFGKETGDHLGCIEEFLAECEKSNTGQCRVAERLARSLHTLTGSARMAQVGPIAQVGRELEELVSSRYAEGRALDAPDQAVLKRGARVIRAVVEALGREGAELPDVSELVRDIGTRRAALPKSAAKHEDRYEAESSLAPPGADALEAQPIDANEPVPKGASAAPAPPPVHPSPEAARAHTPGPVFSPVKQSVEDAELVQIFLEEADDILRFLEGAVERWEAAPEDEARVAELHRSLHTLKGGARLAGFEGIGHLCHALESVLGDVGAQRVPADDRFFDLLHASLDRLTDLLEQAHGGERSSTPQGLIARIEDLRGTGVPLSAPRGDPNRELVEVFLQESADILANTETLLYDWRQNPEAFTGVPELQRALYTLKGGARMAGFKPIADLSQGLETLLEAVAEGKAEFGEALFDGLESANDHLMTLRSTALNGASLPDVQQVLEGLAHLHPGERAVAAVERAAGDTAPAVDEAEQDSSHAPRRQPDQVRVHSQLLDSLVNLAGEVSIYRSRLEQQGGDIVFNLAELGQTVARLREQLRALEIETEAQILYRFEREHGPTDPGSFDPLELDRFSRIQELSRALSESVNDLTNIQGSLNNLNRESETLLLQQSRVNTELQDGLMHTRMVPFANLVPRMRRVVRQACEELGKRAQLKVFGAQGEMDRTVLERLIPPLEHMLRNAVAHGIEAPAVRGSFGKAELGTICVALEREGADVTIRVSDDGAGLNLNAIRSKAISQGLMSEGSMLSDKEIMQFVLEPGFSTAEKVTQIAGRGVGLDVVNAEIKQFGRSLEIDSELGVGTQFTARMPFTLALNQALLCQTGEEVYAIPLSSIEGVVRVGQDELRDIYTSADNGFYSYAGARYEVRSLAVMLGVGDGRPPPERPRVPLILVQAGDHRTALQVDALLGRREIVVKSAGLQISRVPGLLGATILADGRVVFILDVGALARYDIGSSDEDEADEWPIAAMPSRRKRPWVMVVDDSITMRKVATRLLQRNEIDVITAKDGVDAVAALQDVVPDAMLLDIEMPRMDGYELATHMRNDERLRAVPIIVITSRTGDKHRLKATEIGVDRYLGKPYQESELLAALHELLTPTQSHA
ncbi:Hpt domain-containing protein [Nitrococcus mobilis]|uniref:Chemotaxis protein CheA n=1 Tax=Nitrococcus mobilis Nb-231 TaxID=314278 RepID=A4BSC2_9GAMM|nr:Hpt domain-containing protein [Nitrococcus mobilis]EAR21382.1 Chemotaxis protein histidine kinase and related kinase [Nitrococcus mobilis Nb-231]